MGKRIEVPISNGYYELDSIPWSAQTCINLYPQNPIKSGTLSTGALMRTPGLFQVDTLSSGIGRGFHKLLKTNKLYSVNGTQLYVKTNISSNTSLGTIEGSGRVSTADNGITLCIIIPGGKGYFYTESAGLSEITDTIFVDFLSTRWGDADEKSQERMSRALHVASMTGQTETQWTMYDNSVQVVTQNEMIEALTLAIQKQSEIWFI